MSKICFKNVYREGEQFFTTLSKEVEFDGETGIAMPEIPITESQAFTLLALGVEFGMESVTEPEICAVCFQALGENGPFILIIEKEINFLGQTIKVPVPNRTSAEVIAIGIALGLEECPNN